MDVYLTIDGDAVTLRNVDTDAAGNAVVKVDTGLRAYYQREAERAVHEAHGVMKERFAVAVEHERVVALEAAARVAEREVERFRDAARSAAPFSPAELGQAIAAALAQMPAPTVNVTPELRAVLEQAPREVTFDRDAAGRIVGAAID